MYGDSSEDSSTDKSKHYRDISVTQEMTKNRHGFSQCVCLVMHNQVATISNDALSIPGTQS
jgi:hypothetical protein